MATITLSNLTFLFKIVPVKIRLNVAENRQADAHWYPPTAKEDFILDEANSTGWCRWSANGVQEGVPSVNESGPDDDICSVFFDSERDQFLVAPVDCAEGGVQGLLEDMGIGWSRVTFQHLESRHHGMVSKLSFHDHYHWLGAQGSPTWMPQLLPKTYNNNRRSDEYTGLVGELSLLLGFAAFSCEPRRNDMLTTIRESFRPPNWIYRQRNTPSVKLFPYCHDQGLIVRVRPDPSSRIGRAELQNFKNGVYGVLIMP
ncbi:hypothetical protein VTN02DRAFT_6796 [Thermoascus thermophilus]